MPDTVKQHLAVFITGASTGIGAACAIHLDQMGCTVFAGVRSETDAATLQERSSPRLKPIIIDVTKPKQITAAVNQVGILLGGSGLDALINNAGVVVAGPLEFLPIEALRRQFEINVIGVAAVTQAFLPLIRKQKGRILNMSSFAGSVSSPFIGPYHASKFALEAMSDALRMELSPWGIHVAIIKPAAIKTPIWSKVRSDGDNMLRDLPPETVEYYGNNLQIMSNRAKKSEEKGASTDVVSKAVYHAITAKNPKTRYTVAVAPWVLPFIRLLPDRLRDRIILRYLGLNR